VPQAVLADSQHPSGRRELLEICHRARPGHGRFSLGLLRLFSEVKIQNLEQHSLGASINPWVIERRYAHRLFDTIVSIMVLLVVEDEIEAVRVQWSKLS
jgi:hypothetical protein